MKTVSSSADALAASAFSYSYASTDPSASVYETVSLGFGNSFIPSWLLPYDYSSPTDGYRKTTEARSSDKRTVT